MLLSTLAVDLLTEYPELLVAVTIAARLARAWQSSLTWPEYRAAHRFKRGVFPLLDHVAPGRILLVSEKGGRDDGEYLTTIDDSPREVARTLRKSGGSPHLLNSLKRRPAGEGDRLTVAHLVWTHTDDTQTEAYLFRNDDGSTDVYAHHETSTDYPLRHLTETQTNGDVRDVVVDALATEYAEPVADVESF